MSIMKASKCQHVDSLESKINVLTKKVSNMMEKTSKQMETLKRQAGILLRKSEQDILIYQAQAQAQLRQLDNLSLDFNRRIQKQISNRKKKQNQLLLIIEEKNNLLKNQIEKQKRIRQSVFGQISVTLQKDIPSLMDTVLLSAEEREGDCQKIAETTKTDLMECKRQIQQISESSQINNKKLYELIHDLTIKSKKQIQQQKIIRQKTHEYILSYVEQTCNKLYAEE